MKGIAERAGNVYAGTPGRFWAQNAGPALSMAGAALVLLVPLAAFTAVREGWFESEAALGPGEVGIALSNFEIDVTRETLEPGEVTFVIEHEEERGHRGGKPGELHDVVISRIEDDGSVTVVARSDVLESGEEERLTATLAPGRYELLCTVAEEYRGHIIIHAEEGMRTEITVREAPGANSARLAR
jgi:hypothetical protein